MICKNNCSKSLQPLKDTHLRLRLYHYIGTTMSTTVFKLVGEMCTNLSLVRRLTLVTGGISSILPRDQLGVYTHSSGILIGKRHWLGRVFNGAYMEQPTNN